MTQRTDTKRSWIRGRFTPVLLASWAFLSLGVPTVCDEPAPQEFEYPLTIERVWYRTDDGKGLSDIYKATGDLVVTPGRIEFVHRNPNKGWQLDTSSVRTVSFGKMRGDVDTDWAVLLVENESGRSLIGIRDGRKMGYGTQTKRIFDILKEALRRDGAAQYQVPEGLETYDALEHLFTVGIPEGWLVFHDELEVTESGIGEGVVRFSPEGDDPTSWFSVERRSPRKGVRCDELAPKVLAGLEKEFGVTAGEPFEIDGCSAVTFEIKEDIRVLAVGSPDWLFLIRIKSNAWESEGWVNLVDGVLSTFRFTAAR